LGNKIGNKIKDAVLACAGFAALVAVSALLLGRHEGAGPARFLEPPAVHDGTRDETVGGDAARAEPFRTEALQNESSQTESFQTESFQIESFLTEIEASQMEALLEALSEALPEARRAGPSQTESFRIEAPQIGTFRIEARQFSPAPPVSGFADPGR